METKNLIGGLLAGAAIGVTVGLLLAPRSGKETIDKVTKGSKRLADDLKNAVGNSMESLMTQHNNGVDEATRSGKDVLTNASKKIKV